MSTVREAIESLINERAQHESRIQEINVELRSMREMIDLRTVLPGRGGRKKKEAEQVPVNDVTEAESLEIEIKAPIQEAAE